MTTISCQSCGSTVPSGKFCATCGNPLQPSDWAHETSQITSFEKGSRTSPVEATKRLDADLLSRALSASQATAVKTAHQGLNPDELLAPPTPPGPELALVSGSPARLGWRGNRTTGIAAVTITLVAVAAYGIFGLGAEKHTVTGDLALTTTNTLSAGDSCHGDGGYSDITEGTQVIIEDDTGKTLATSAFGPGSFDGTSCVFNFAFTDVPKEPFYRVHQSGNRGVLQYSYNDMVNNNWAVHLTLGDN